MEQDFQLKIYKGMIQYLLTATHYNLKDIADLTNAPIKSIHAIHFGQQVQLNPFSELQLVKIYHFVLELKLKERLWMISPLGETP